ncbi:MAG: hypothetical protein JNM93_03530 [Bacteriovoracaceae bacterium]|nr:hypothetical protein [Bacteriovoracaceae bacterium]
MFKYFLLCLLSLSLFSCSVLKKRKALNSEVNNAGGIFISTDGEDDIYGPAAPIDHEEVVPTKREPLVSLVCPPGLLRAVSCLGVLKGMEREHKKVNMLVGVEFGALISALYSKYKKASVVEWHLFSLGQELKDEKARSKNWDKKIKKFILKHFEGSRLEQLGIPLILPLYSKQQEQVFYVKKGDVVTILNSHLVSDFPDKLNVFPPMELEFLSEEEMTNRGADIVVYIDVLGEKFNLKWHSGLIWGIYSGFISRSSLEKTGFSFVIKPATESIAIDDAGKIVELINLGEKIYKTSSIELEQKLNLWKEENNP